MTLSLGILVGVRCRCADGFLTWNGVGCRLKDGPCIIILLTRFNIHPVSEILILALKCFMGIHA